MALFRQSTIEYCIGNFRLEVTRKRIAKTKNFPNNKWVCVYRIYHCVYILTRNEMKSEFEKEMFEYSKLRRAEDMFLDKTFWCNIFY